MSVDTKKNCFLLKPAELSLKGNNRNYFEKILKQNILRKFADGEGKNNSVNLRITNGRFFLECSGDKSEFAENVLSRLPGISGWAKAEICNKNIDEIIAVCVKEGKKTAGLGKKTFKIDARRTDKSFPLSSYDLCCRAGEAILTAGTGLKVDVHNPDEIIHIEIREKVYIYPGGEKGLGGLPAGSAGGGLLLLSGGIDSPVAGFLMALRGMSLDAIHFHSYPYTSEEAKQKVISLAKILGSYCPAFRLYVINFTQVQMRIKERCPAPWTTVMLRMAMMEAAEKIGNKIKSKALITGESLSQVASQTIENLNCTQSRIKLPVLRPLIGLNKESIIKEARRIGTFDISIQPHEDCCMLFTPRHPVLRGNPEEACMLYDTLEIESLIDKASESFELIG